VHIDRVVILPDPNGRLAADFQPRWPSTEAMTLLAAGEELAEYAPFRKVAPDQA